MTDNEIYSKPELQSYQLSIPSEGYLLIQKFMNKEVPSNYKGGAVIISWNDIMPVVEKISKLYTNSDHDRHWNSNINGLRSSILFVSIDNVYQYVVEFIKWYNTQIV